MENLLDTIWYNVVKMLKNRGHDIQQINTFIPIELLKLQYNRQLTGENAMDIFIRGEQKKCYVKFLTNKDVDTKNKKDYASIHYHTEMLTQTQYLGEQDEIIFVLLIENVEMDKCYAIEELDNRVRVFPYKRLLFDLAEHDFVPPHERIDQTTRKTLKKQLNIENWSKLPALERSDAVCRYYGYQRGDVIRITRPTYTSGPHVVFRIVI